MKYTYSEYSRMITMLNINRNKYVLTIGTILSFILSFVINYSSNYKIEIILLSSLICSFIFYYIMRNIITNNAKKLNRNNKFIEMKQEISEDFIVEIEKRENEILENKYKFSSVVKVRKDKCNYYLYLEKNKAIIISKAKLKDQKEFEKLIYDKKTSK